jgi:DNA polymerase-3 subunit beta
VKIIVAQAVLNKALSTVGRAATGKIPVLTGVRLEAAGDVVKVRTSDLSIAIETQVPCRNEQSGALLLDAKVFANLVKRAPIADLAIETSKNGASGAVSWDGGKYTVPGFEANTFPSWPKMSEPSTFTLERGRFQRFLKQLAFAGGVVDGKPYLDGVEVRLDGNTLRGTATDGDRIAMDVAGVENPSGEQFGVIIPKRTVSEVSSLLSEDDERPISINVAANGVEFDLDGIRIHSVLLDGVFPDVRRFVPSQFETGATIDRLLLREALDRATAVVGNALWFEFGGAVVRVHASQPDKGQATEDIPVESIGGATVKIGLNARLVMDYLKVLDAKEVRVDIVSARNPVMVKPVGESSSEYLLMPLIKVNP